MKNKPVSIFLLLILIFGTFLLTGCGGKEEIGAYGHDRIKDQSRWAEAGENVPDFTLADGQILAIRLVYDPEEESSDTDWYKVQLSRIGKTWKDSVKIKGIIRSKPGIMMTTYSAQKISIGKLRKNSMILTL